MRFLHQHCSLKNIILRVAFLCIAQFICSHPCISATAGVSTGADLEIVSARGGSSAVVRSPEAGPYELRAVEDLVKYIELMTGVRLPIIDTPDLIATAIASSQPVLIVGEQALRTNPALRSMLTGVLKKNPSLRTDGIALRREANRIYIAGNNDEAHYLAVAELLRLWGVRWFMPGDFGEYVPEERELKIGRLDYAFSSPFEIRSYWVSWLADSTGLELFQKRNMLSGHKEMPPIAHVLGLHMKGLSQPGVDISLTDPKTAQHVANSVEKLYAASKNFSLSMDDRLYSAESERDRYLTRLKWDKHFASWSITDPMLEFYNNVTRILRTKYPASTSKIGILAYSNMTSPPVRDIKLAPEFYAELAPIDIDPIHGMGDPRFPEKLEFEEILKGWAKASGGRLAIYDYDQSMLVWRDIPNPTHMAFLQDVKRYRDAGILGVETESRNALATTFLNLYLRSRLLWNPDENVESLLDDFYPKFFGPAAGPMRQYWNAIFGAWERTIVTEHEYFVAPAIYDRDLVARLGAYLNEAEAAIQKMSAERGHLSRNQERYVERMRFMRLGYTVLEAYISMVHLAATESDYVAAVEAGERGLRARDELTAMNRAFTATRLETGYAFWPGEVRQYRELIPLINGERGLLLAKLPLLWAFRRDPQRTGMENGFVSGPPDLSFWNAHWREFDLYSRKDYPADKWEMIQTDLYVQAQGIRLANSESFVGDIWYRTSASLSQNELDAAPHIYFPGLFNKCELYLNGKEVARRNIHDLWWISDYRFEWDVPLHGHLHLGENQITLRCHNPHHMGGMFRRPFLYSPR